jgi:hypothetical protein
MAVHSITNVFRMICPWLFAKCISKKWIFLVIKLVPLLLGSQILLTSFWKLVFLKTYIYIYISLYDIYIYIYAIFLIRRRRRERWRSHP